MFGIVIGVKVMAASSETIKWKDRKTGDDKSFVRVTQPAFDDMGNLVILSPAQGVGDVVLKPSDKLQAVKIVELENDNGVARARWVPAS